MTDADAGPAGRTTPEETDPGSDADPDPVQEADPTDGPWAATLDDVAALAAAREAAGFDAVALPTVEAVPEAPGEGATDRFGLTLLLDEGRADRFRAAFRRGTYPTYEVFRRAVSGRVYLVVEYRDPDAETAILLAGRYDAGDATGMVRAARAAGELYTHALGPDGEHLGSFHHDSHAKFVPDRIDHGDDGDR